MRPKKLTINNYVIFGENQTVSFEENDIIINGVNDDAIGLDSNGSGKTLLVDAISEAIVGQSSRKIPVDEIVRDGAEEYTISLIAEHKEDELIITRGHNGKSPKMELTINGEDKTQRTASLTHDYLMNYLGLDGTPAEVFSDLHNTVYLNTDSIDLFASKKFTSSDRFAFVSRILQADKWLECRDEAKDHIKELESRIESLQTQQENIEISIANKDDLEKQIINYNEELNSLKETLKQIRSDIQTIQDNKEIDEKINTLYNRNQKYSETTRERLVELGSFIDDLSKDKQKLDDAKYNSANIYIQDVSILEEELETLIKDKNDIKKSIETQQDRHNDYVEKIKNLKEGHYLTCPSCDTHLHLREGNLKEVNPENIEAALTEFEKKKNEVRNDIIHELRQTEQELSNKIDNLKEEIQTRKDNKIEKEKYEVIIDTYKEVPNKLAQNKDKHESLFNEFKASQEEYKRKMRELKNSLPDNLPEETVENLKDKESQTQDEIDTVKNNIAITTNEVSKLKEKESQLESITNDIDSLVLAVEQYSFWVDGFVEIRRLVIENFLPTFESTANELLSQLEYEATVVLSTLRETKSGSLREEFNVNIIDQQGNERTIDSYSGGERKRLGLAIAMALHQTIREMRNNDFFEFYIFDEILDSLDITGVQNFIKLTNSIQDLKLFITHNEELSRFFNSKVIVEKHNGISSIKKA